MNGSAKRFVIALSAVLLIVPLALAVPPGSDDDIRARLAPAGQLCKVGDECGSAAAAVASGPLSGQQVYDQFCFACHATGVSGAPMFGDGAQWAERTPKGVETLVQSTVNGLNAMPPMGTCMNCSDDEIAAAVDYMLENI